MLNRVTITGADDNTNIGELLYMSTQFPFVEWGILVSKSKSVAPRYPSMRWIQALQIAARQPLPMQLSLHVCGHWTRQLLMGENELPVGLTEAFQRVQLNFHARGCNYSPSGLWQVLRQLSPPRQIIFQIDGEKGVDYFNSVFSGNYANHWVDVVPLYDTSGGVGVLPKGWPVPAWAMENGDWIPHGYAGGLGPENLTEQLAKIARAADKCTYWVDMETRVRTEDGENLDMKKVEKVLEISRDFIRHQ